MPDVNTTPHAWLIPFWTALKRQTFFDKLAPELQSEALALALEADHPAKAQEIREWNFATRRGMLAGLDMLMVDGPAKRETELWRMQKGQRVVCCTAVYLPVGVDLRLLEGADMLRTELFRDTYAAPLRSREWQAALAKSGWREPVAAESQSPVPRSTTARE